MWVETPVLLIDSFGDMSRWTHSVDLALFLSDGIVKRFIGTSMSNTGKTT